MLKHSAFLIHMLYKLMIQSKVLVFSFVVFVFYDMTL